MKELTNFQKDALLELANIGSGNAATALSQLIGKDITLNLPSVSFVPVVKISEKFGKGLDIVAAVYLRIYGEINGRALIFFPKDKVFPIIDLLMKRKSGETKELGETEQSALKEIGNIILSSYLNAIAKFIGLNSVPSVPSLAIDMIDAIFETVSAEIAEADEDALLIENEMIEKTTMIKSSLLIIPDKETMVKIIKALDSTIKGI